MAKTVELEVAQATLVELIAGLTPDEDIVIVKGQQPLAKLVAAPAIRQRRKAGNCEGMITLLVEDDEHLKDFAEYMP